MLKDMYKDIGGYDMAYWEFKEMCREAWGERFNYLCFDMTRNKIEGIYRILNENKNTDVECIPETEIF